MLAMPHRSPARLLTVALGALAIAALAPGAAAAEPAGRAARACSAPKYPGEGYFTSLSVKKTTCAAGRKVTMAHYRCRTRSGKAGRCRGKVKGYSCKERRASIPTEINGRVTCTDGARRVVYSYQQNT